MATDDIEADIQTEDIDNLDEDKLVTPHEMPARLRDFVLCSSLCNTATIQRSQEEGGNGKWEANGDATEIALIVFAYKLGHGRPYLLKEHAPAHLKRQETNVSMRRAKPPVVSQDGHYEKLVEHPFDSTVKRMTVAYRFIPSQGSDEKGHVLVLMKGAIERVFDLCSKIGLAREGATDLNSEHREEITHQYEDLAAQGLRVLTLCGKRLSDKEAEGISSMPRDQLETGEFGFLGLAGIFDPPRPESKAAVNDCKRATVTPRMLTGDHKATAIAIAQSIGIINRAYSKHEVMTGPEFDKLTEDEIDELPSLPRVIARCAPETKVRMVEALHRRKRSTIMTGDGVNDAPALKRADVGVAMGTGSDVAKQSGEMILTDDQFDTIVRAVRKGRSIFANLSKFLLYLLSGNVAEVLILMIGLVFQDPAGESTFPISPVAALWINTLAAGPPALALGLEPTDPSVMDNTPDDYKTIFTLSWWIDLIFYGLLMAALGLCNFVIVLYGYYSGEIGLNCNETYSDGCNVIFQARGACFASFLIVLMAHAITCKNPSKSIFQMNLFDNKVLLWCCLALALSVFPVIYIPTINDEVFLLGSLTWEWGPVFGSILVYFVIAELYKMGRKKVIARHNAKIRVQQEEVDSKAIGITNTIAAP